MRHSWIAVGLAAVLGCATPLPPDLVGRWQSDGARTLADIDSRDAHTPEQRAAMAEVLGDLVYELRTDGTYDWTIDGYTESAEYRVVAIGPGFVEFEGHDDLLDEVRRTRLWLEGDHFWMRAGSEKRRFREYFRRIR